MARYEVTQIQNWVPCTPQPFHFQQKLDVTLFGKEISKCAAQVEGPAAVQVHVELVAMQPVLRTVIQKGGVRRQLIGAKKQNKTHTNLSIPERKCLIENTL